VIECLHCVFCCCYWCCCVTVLSLCVCTYGNVCMWVGVGYLWVSLLLVVKFGLFCFGLSFTLVMRSTTGNRQGLEGHNNQSNLISK
jgi:hypothetical protein